MGMRLVWKDVTPSGLAALLKSPEHVEGFIISNPIYRRTERVRGEPTCPSELLAEWRSPSLSLGRDGKSWTDVEYLLRRSGETSYLGKELIKGGTPFGPELGYGQARYWTAEELASLVRNLPSPDDLGSHFGAGDRPFPQDGRTQWEEERDRRIAEAWGEAAEQNTAAALQEYRAVQTYLKKASEAGHALLSYFV